MFSCNSGIQKEIFFSKFLAQTVQPTYSARFQFHSISECLFVSTLNTRLHIVTANDANVHNFPGIFDAVVEFTLLLVSGSHVESHAVLIVGQLEIFELLIESAVEIQSIGHTSSGQYWHLYIRFLCVIKWAFSFRAETNSPKQILHLIEPVPVCEPSSMQKNRLLFATELDAPPCFIGNRFSKNALILS